ncbi:MAG: deoxyribodipyrimidine photo-lyase [Chlamydiales bacterium]|nr:deoxyribodipyrimidine photo-lyase [Chlamydiales bacterium]
MFGKGLFIFRRDLRIHDNRGLIYALENAEEVFCIFIFTPEQISDNPYRSDFCLQFMLESLEDLEEEIAKKKGRLSYFFESPQKAVEKCITKLGVDLVVVNRDYTPYSIQRDKTIQKVCKDKEVVFKSFDDVLLHPPENLLKSDGNPYTVFTPFYKNAVKLPVDSPRKNLYKNYSNRRIDFAKEASPFKKILANRHVAQKGGRKEALRILKNLHRFSRYEPERDYPFMEATTHLSPHLKFTTVSPREVYYKIEEALGPNTPLSRSLYWRDFFSSIAFYFPYVFGGAFHEKYDRLNWSKSSSHFKSWCEGRTGFPIVDAGMRELNQTGYMHNRVRMIVASFFVKDLHLDWKKGEKYFAQHLLDYDPAVNNGNWQWAASTGCDAQPYFRIFNPWRQQIKFDSECHYIKKWIPELLDKDPKRIHEWYKEEKEEEYPLPIVDHAIESKKALANYKSI